MKERKKIEKILTAVVAPVLVIEYALTACSGSGDKEKASTTPTKRWKRGVVGKFSKLTQVIESNRSQEFPSMDSRKATDQYRFLLKYVMEGYISDFDKDNKAAQGCWII